MTIHPAHNHSRHQDTNLTLVEPPAYHHLYMQGEAPRVVALINDFVPKHPTAPRDERPTGEVSAWTKPRYPASPHAG